MEIYHPKIDDKVCETKSVGTSSSGGGKKQYALYKESTETKSNTAGGTALCGGEGHTGSSITSGHGDAPQSLKNFVAKTLKDGNQNWPTSKGEGTKPNDNAKNVATDLTKLTSEEKTIVAGLLAKTIEGGVVVEMCLSPST
ncbi:putative p44-44 outer membrane protein, silent [Anaplasma phagocytophilum str. ApNP]|uniref:Putative p44-44 outer membrane protein, silent n=1 Tax=Anaplasma phagocytophilum str. ApNP TaxID=1359153 RepID=A0A0F3NGV3_ANAPH|nr:putative p44-44 outer membrane protein, silent [Anaplasma phagocytophilum str. ApNP]